MEITEVRFTFPERSDGRVMAYCSVVFDRCFRVRDLRVISKNKELFVAMPSRKTTRECERCGGKNNQNVKFCNHCGTSMAFFSGRTSEKNNGDRNSGREANFVDLAHPITAQFRRKMEKEIIQQYHQEAAKAG